MSDAPHQLGCQMKNCFLHDAKVFHSFEDGPETSKSGPEVKADLKPSGLLKVTLGP